MYIVEGNIGVGKSTFLSLIKKHLPAVSCILEPVDNWANQTYGQSLLEKFYTNPQRWAYTLETLAMICRSRDHISVQQKHPYHLVERSIYSGHYCFALNGYQDGYFNELEWDIYNRWVSFFFNQKCKPPHGFIYLRAQPEVCYDRIEKRRRKGENQIAFEYLRKIHVRHEQFLIHKETLIQTLKNVPVLILTVDQDFVDHKKVMKQHAIRIEQFMRETSGIIYP